jgi:hypothetical protein
VTLYTEGSDGFVTSTAAPIATEWNEPVLGRDFHPQRTSAFHGAQHSSTKEPEFGAGSFFKTMALPSAEQVRSKRRVARILGITPHGWLGCGRHRAM